MELNETKKKLLRLDLQYFAEGDGDGADDGGGYDGKTADKSDDKVDDVDDSKKGTDGEPDKADGDVDDDGGDDGEGAKTFTQEDVNRIVQERLDRQKRKDEQKRLEEEGKYKELYEKLQSELQEKEEQAIKASKESAIIKAGYSEEQLPKLLKFVEGETRDEIQQSIEELTELIPVKQDKQYADPSAGNGKKNEPKKTDLADKGREAVKRLRAKGKIR